MKAVVIRKHGSFDRLKIEDVDLPKPRPDEVRVKVKVAGLNHLDTWVRRGIDGVKFPLPLIPGCDGAGVVDKVGDVAHGIKTGSEVILVPGLGHPMDRDYGILGETRDGTCGDFIVVPRQNVLPKPTGMAWEAAGSFSLTFLTAWAMLVRRAQIRPGEWVLIHAGGSGVGVAALQMAKLFSCRVIVTASTEEKRRRLKEMGADEAIPYDDFSNDARRITGKAGVDVVVDHIGPDTWQGSIACLRRGGRLVTCGGTSGHEIHFDVRHLFFKGLSFLGNTMGTLEEQKAVLEHVKAGRLVPVIDSVFPLDQIKDAHRRLADRAVFGKVVVTL